MEYLASLGHRMTHHCDNATYNYRIDDPDNFNFCAVPGSGVDVILFIGIALVVSIAFSSRLSAIFILLIGAVLQFISYQTNLGRLSNALTLWLRMQPAELFMYIFLPPLLLDSAVKLDFHLLKKILLLALLFAFVLVMLSTILSVPILLYVLNLASQGWTWVHCGLFSAMIASTDAVAVSAVLKSGGAPEMLGALLEGESLFNDASGLVLFDIFLRMLPSTASSSSANTLDQNTDNLAGLSKKGHIEWDALKEVAGQFVWLAGGGLAMGLAYGFGTVQLMRWLQRRRQKPYVEVTVTVVGTYLAYYTTSLYLGASGVIACVVFGLYGAASMNWRMSLKSKREASMQRFWDVVSFSLNGIVFFYVGASSCNFLIRLGVDLSHDGSSMWEIMKDLILTLPLIYVAFFLLRGALIMSFVFIAKRFGAAGTPPWQGVVFATVGGLRGALSLILAQTMLTLHSNTKVEEFMDTNSKASQERKVLAQMGLWTTGFVLLTLLLNAPLLGNLLTLLKLNKPSAAKQHVRQRVRHALLRYTEHTLDMLQAESETTGLRGVDWESVRRYVSLERALQRVLPKAEFKPERRSLLQHVMYWAGVRRRARPVDRSPSPENGTGLGVGTSEPSPRLIPQDSLTEPLLQRDVEGERAGIGRPQHVGSLSSRARARGGDMTPFSLQSPSLQSRQSMRSLSRDVSGRRSQRSFRVDSTSLDTTPAVAGPVQGPVARSAPITRATSYAADLQYEALMMQARQSSCFFANKPEDEARRPVSRSASFTAQSTMSGELAPHSRTSLEGTSTSPAASLMLPEGSMAITVRSRSKLQDHELGVVEEEDTPVASDMEHNYSQEARIPDDDEIEQFIAEIQAASQPGIDEQEQETQSPFQRGTHPAWLQTGDECPGILEPQTNSCDMGPQSSSSSHTVSPFAAMAASTTTEAVRETVAKADGNRAAQAMQPVQGLGAALLAESAAVAAITGAVTGTTVAAAGTAQPQLGTRVAATAATTAAKLASEVAVATAAPIVSTIARTAAIVSTKGAAQTSAWRPIPGNGAPKSSYRKQLSSLSPSSFKPESELNTVQRSLSMTAGMASQIRRSLRLTRAMTGSQGSLIVLTKDFAGSGDTGRRPGSSSSSSSGDALKMQLSIGGSPATKPMTVEIPGQATSKQFPMEELFDDVVSSPSREGTARPSSAVMSAPHKEAVAEYRIRLLSGLKRAFHARHVEGLLSGHGLRILDSCCDAAMDMADQQPLDLWQRVEQEVSNTALVRLQASLHLQLRKAYSTARYAGFFGGWLVAPLLQWMSHLLGTNLSRHMVLGLEAAIEVHDALTYTPQALWLTYSGGKAGLQLQDEVQEQRHKVWQYMLDREVEAPERFGAIQTHRASMAVLRAQTGFVGHLLESGMIDERECDGLMVPLERQMWKLETRGPKWRHPSLLQVLAGVHFLRGVKPEILDWLRSQGELALYPKGACITSDISHVFIVVSGMVRVTFPAAQQATPVSAGQQLDAVFAASEDTNVSTEDEAAYVGTGGVVRLSRGLLGQKVPGLSVTSVHAEGNALGNGPILFHIPDDTIAKIREYSARGSPHFKDLEAGMFCLLATNLMDRYRVHIITYLVQLLVLQYQDQLSTRQPTPVSRTMSKPAVNLHTGFTRPGADAEPELEEDIVEGVEDLEEEDQQPTDGVKGISGVSERQMQRFIDQGIMLFDRLRPRLQSASLLRLGPRQRLTQQCMVVLLSGSMVQNNSNASHQLVVSAEGTDASSNHVNGGSEHGTAHGSVAATAGTSIASQWMAGAHAPMVVYKPPQIVLWLPDILDNAFLRVIDFKGGEFIAGPTGAVLVVSDNRRQRVPVQRADSLPH